jgi:hypothetical protein
MVFVVVGAFVGVNKNYKDTVSNLAVAFPGTEWLNRIASADTAFTWKGVKYTSAYDAMLEGDASASPCRNLNAFINSVVLPTGVAERKLLVTGEQLITCSATFIISSVLCWLYYGTAGGTHYCYVHPVSQDAAEECRHSSRGRKQSNTAAAPCKDRIGIYDEVI